MLKNKTITTNNEYNTALVILNYKTPEDTIALVKNIEKQLWSKKIKIFIVDNGSNDDSIEKFNYLNSTIETEIIKSTTNLGFAKGNNLGIKKALLDGFHFIIVSNSDIIIEKQSNFIEKIYDIYLKDKQIAIIAPSIKNLDGAYQNPFRKDRFSKQEIIKMKLFYLSGFYKIYYFLRVYIFYSLITYITQHRKKKIEIKNLKNKLPQSGYIYAPHGSFLIFTPTFFKFYNGFDKNTFLYCEEFILAERLKENNLLCWFENTLSILHKESQSTNKITKNYRRKVKFTLKHTFASCKYLVKLLRN